MQESAESIIYKLSQRRKLPRNRNREAGQVLALTAVSLVVLLLAAGLAIDVGFLRFQKRRIQNAADAAAIAGAAETPYPNPSNNVGIAAINDSNLNGFKDTSLGGTANVTVQCATLITATFGACSSNTPFVQVTVAQQQPLFFMSIIPSVVKPTISAQATGYLGNGTTCIYALAPNIASVTGSTEAMTTLNLNGCALISDGYINVQICENTFSALAIGYIGSATVSGCTASPNPKALATPAGDPLAYLTPPVAPGACTATGPFMASGGTISAGTYPCGIQVTTGANVTFGAGTYILGNSAGVALNIGGPGPGNSAAGAQVTGTDVTFYIASGQVLICTVATGPINSNTGCANAAGGVTSVNLTAPTAGPYAGILFYQDPNDSSNNPIGPGTASIIGNDVNGTGTTTLEGVFYFPTAQLNLAEITNQANPTTGYNAVVANVVSLIGTINFGDGSDDYSNNLNSVNGFPIKDAVLVQ
jgi:Flp pilus assembly protein TadG